jgi:hypothetical protein
MPASPSMKVIPLRVEAVLRKAGSYDISPSLAEVRGADRAVRDRDLDLVSGAVVPDRQRLSATAPPYSAPGLQFGRRGTPEEIRLEKE